MQALAKNKMVNGLDFDESGFFESCVEVKGHRLLFRQSTEKGAEHPLDLIHSNVCGKIGTKSLDGGKYIVTFIDDQFVWVYILKHKGGSFPEILRIKSPCGEKTDQDSLL